MLARAQTRADQPNMISLNRHTEWCTGEHAPEARCASLIVAVGGGVSVWITATDGGNATIVIDQASRYDEVPLAR